VVRRPDDALLRLAFDSDAQSPRRVRRAFAERFADHECLDVLLLCLSEVVTNAVLHARTGGSVVVCERPEGLRVEASDGSAARPVHRHFTELSPTGRGLHLLDRLSDRWGIDDVSTGGKVVWFEITTGDTT